MAQARTLALSGGKSPKYLGGNLGDFGEFCKGLRMCVVIQESKGHLKGFTSFQTAF